MKISICSYPIYNTVFLTSQSATTKSMKKEVGKITFFKFLTRSWKPGPWQATFSLRYFVMTMKSSTSDPHLIHHPIWARSFLVSNLRSETKDSRCDSGCYLCTEVSSL